MSAESTKIPQPVLDLSPWRFLPFFLIMAGITCIVVGLITTDLRQLGFSWLVSFAFYLSLSLGALFLLMMHHLFDAAWTSPIRRIMEHMACLASPALLILFIPVALLASRIYPHFSIASFAVVSILCLAGWSFLAQRLRHWSLEQDQSGAARSTHKMRAYSAGGLIFYVILTTLFASLFLKNISGHWFSTIHGLWYLTASVWVSIALLYALCFILRQTGHLREVLREEQFYFLGALLLAFTLFYGYICYSQYLIIWNANIPQENFWYVLREHGNWKQIGLILLFGHFVLPFLLLLKGNWKLKPRIMLPLCAWAGLMHFLDLQFQIMPALHPSGWTASGLWADLGCMMFFAGVTATFFLRSLKKHPPFPLRDPRMAEALGIQTPPTTHIATAPEQSK